MRYFLGAWSGTGIGQPGTSTIEREYRFALGNRFIPDEFLERFEIAEPNGAFEVYSEARFRRKK